MSTETKKEILLEAVALKCFRTVHGLGDAGGEFAFHAQNPAMKEGWMNLAKLIASFLLDLTAEHALAGVIGPTGKFPQGKIQEDDEGELCAALSVKYGKVIIQFGKEISWLAMDSKQALHLSEQLREITHELT